MKLWTYSSGGPSTAVQLGTSLSVTASNSNVLIFENLSFELPVDQRQYFFITASLSPTARDGNSFRWNEMQPTHTWLENYLVTGANLPAFGIQTIKGGEPATTALVHLDFNETLTNRSGNGRHARLFGGGEYQSDRNGRPRSSFSFDGTDDQLEFAQAPVSMAGLFTVIAFVEVSPLAAMAPVFHTNFVANKQSGLLFYVDNLGKVRVTIGVGGDAGLTAGKMYATTTAINSSTWAHIACVLDASGAVRIFIGGIEQPVTESGTGGAMQLLPGGKAAIGVADTNRFDIPFEHFRGLMDEFKIFNEALDQEEILNHSRNGSGLKNPQVHLSFNGNTGNISGSGNDPLYTGGDPVYTSNRFDHPRSALLFNGLNNWLSLGKQPEFHKTTGFLLQRGSGSKVIRLLFSVRRLSRTSSLEVCSVPQIKKSPVCCLATRVPLPERIQHCTNQPHQSYPDSGYTLCGLLNLLECLFLSTEPQLRHCFPVQHPA